MLLVAAAVLLLGVESAGQELQSGRISQRELRSLFVHHQAYCRDLEDQTYASLAKHHCEASPRHVWFRDESSILPEDQFHQRHLDKVSMQARSCFSLSTAVALRGFTINFPTH